jgi:methylthioribose-1-phosphate isomerase
MSELRPLRYSNGVLELIDQLALPLAETWIRCATVAEVGAAIREMKIRGAPAIGCTAAYGMAIAARAAAGESRESFLAALEQARLDLSRTRPTAVNLFWALERMRQRAETEDAAGRSPREIAAALEEEAVLVHEEDVAMCRRIGDHGRALIPDRATVLTHCNAGALATGGYGTALGVLRAAQAEGKALRVLADETRPFLQGARLTAWELQRDGFDVTIVPDGAAAFLISRGEVTCAVVGADRIAANGDVANKIGTYGVALAARAAGMPFYVAAPSSTIDLSTPTGADIPIEMRDGAEVLELAGSRVAPEGSKASYPAFDITPAELVTAIITDTGVARPPYAESLPRHASQR